MPPARHPDAGRLAPPPDRPGPSGRLLARGDRRVAQGFRRAEGLGPPPGHRPAAQRPVPRLSRPGPRRCRAGAIARRDPAGAGPHMSDRLVGLLSALRDARLDLSAEDVADAIWLAPRLGDEPATEETP